MNSNQDKVIKFLKPITKIKYLDDVIIIGDFSGKLHFINNIELKVKFIYKFN